MSKPFAWSYSVLTSFETCPRRHYLIKVAKTVNETQSPQMLHGNIVHKALEMRLKERQPLPDTLASYEPFAASIEATGGVIEAEQKMGLDINYQPTGFFAKDIWVRAITDVTVVKKAKAAVIDWKTGRPTPASAQLALCAGVTFAQKPWLEKIITSFVWLAEGTTTNQIFLKSDVPAIWQEFAPRVRRLEQALESQTFPPKPSGLCAKWCPVPKGACEFSGKT